MKKLFIIVTLLILAGCGSTAKNTRVEVTQEFTSEDPTYGYTQSNPIQPGGFLMGTPHHGAHYEYFQSLRGPDGEFVTVSRLGSCCGFEDDSLPFGGGLLDRYELNYEGQSKSVVIYVNLYKFEKPKAPVGFTLL